MTNFSKLKVGNVLSETQFYVVKKIKGDQVQLNNDHNEPIVVSKDYVEKCLHSAEQFVETKTLSKTEVAALFIQSVNVAVTVSFQKQIKESDVTKEIQEAYENSTPKEFATKMKKAVKKGLEGEERVMLGRHYGSVNEFGRVMFIDMEDAKDSSKEYDTRYRQVDPRSINYFICRNVKYVVK